MQKKIKRRFSEKNYSLIGKISIEKFPIIHQKDKIIQGIKKRYKIRDLFHPDQPKEEIKYIEDYDKFCNYKLSSKNKNKINNNKLINKDNNHDSKFYYHNKHLSLVDKFKKLVIQADNFSYAPKYDFVKPRLLTGPGWDYGSEKLKEKIIYDNRDYYIKHEDVLNNPNIKCLVNMNKTTQRIEFVKQKDIKFKNDKKYISRFKSKKNMNNKNKFKYKIALTSRNNKSRNNLYNLFNIKTSKTSKTTFNERGEKTCSKDHKSSSKEKKRNSKIKKNKRQNKKNHSVDFKKIISREEVEKVKEYKYFKIPFITPNYTLVEDRLLSTISYDTPKYNTNNNTRKEQIEGYDYRLKYSPDKYISKFNNHINPQSPNFTYMFHRNGDWSKNSKNNSLPFYMRDIYDRNSVERMTEKSLKQNKFKEGKISLASSTFFPKKSFNRVININLINSKNFKEKLNDDYIEEKKEYLKSETERKNNKNEINKLKNIGLLNKFENFTFKALDKREKNYSKNDSMEDIFNIV